MINNMVLIVDDEASVRRFIEAVMHKAGYATDIAENGLEAVKKARIIHPAVMIMDIKMPVMDGMEAFRLLREENPDIAVVLMTAFGTMDTAVEAMRLGAFDYLVKPSNVAELRIVVERAFQLQHLKLEIATLRTEVQDKYQIGNIIGRSAVMQQVYKTVGRVAPTNATVLVTGESGSGKEMIAKTVHNNSLRRDGPFIKVNCGALPDGLIESELFGYEKGAFTGAAARKPGRFDLANHGTLLLDEVGELPPPLQVKLLRVLQEQEFERLGGVETIKVDVRIIAATNKNLEDMVKRGSFRKDLFYRLNVVPIRIPPLRDRKEDIPLFVDYYVRRLAQEAHKEIPYVTKEAMHLLEHYHWPGNVRELANALERAVIMSTGVIDVTDLPGLIPADIPGQYIVPSDLPLKDVLRQVEKQVIAQALKKHRGNRVKTALALDISRRALLYKIEEYGLGKVAEDAGQPAEETDPG